MNKRVIFFSDPLCGACEMMKPVVERLANTAWLEFVISEDPTEAALFNISTNPTVLTIKCWWELGRLEWVCWQNEYTDLFNSLIEDQWE